ncbi:hypothetical protein OUZ56_001647 [Daphnia magna]|uniref:Uncharacterized protein n=1 Tax=Daphnia magna TaxID=35525 RepID=A0ABR0A3A5_9CRUS|nr:hypothetical protein OUZ56_001647 [Daphnia magna]
MFVKVVDRTANDLNVTWNNLLLGQVALIPDLIESTSHMASSRADAIKTHNGSEMVRQLCIYGRVVEPLKDFHKDEVASWVCPQNYSNVARFLLPVLSIRIIYAEELFLEADFVETQVGFKLRRRKNSGDCRTYSYCVELSSDQTQPNWNDLASYARLIQRVCNIVNRVCYVFGKPVRESVTDVTPTYLTSKILAILREADYLANKILRDSGCSEKLEQMPIVLIPFTFIAIRDFMTGLPAIHDTHLPQEVVDKMVEAVLTVPGIFRVLYDLTAKPSWTTEWE